MLEGVKLGFDDRQRRVFSACRGCEAFRAICLEGNCGYGCICGKGTDNFISFDYPFMDADGRMEQLRSYQEDELPEDCLFHTQCSMLSFMDDGSALEEIAGAGFTVEEVCARSLDFSKGVLATIARRDSSLSEWCATHDATAFLLKQDGEVHAVAIMDVERDADYSWIQPEPPHRHYLQKGTAVLGIRALHSDGAVVNGDRLLLSCAYRMALRENATEFYAVSYSDTVRMLQRNGFIRAGWMYGGDSSDDELGAEVLVKKVNELEDK